MAKPPKKKEVNVKKRKKTALIVCLLSYLVIAFFIIHIGIASEGGAKSLYKAIPLGIQHALTEPFAVSPFPQSIFPILGLETLAFAALIYFVSVNMRLRWHDDLDTIAGDAKWLSESELEAYNYSFTEPFDSYDTSSYNNIIMSNDIKLSMDAKHTNRNLNVLVIGGSGTGKSFRIVGPNILQRNCSMVITDPSGGLFKQYSSYLEYYGYKIKCFNLDHMERSNHYNPFNYIANDKDIEILVTMLITNTTSPNAKGGDDFWEKCEIALLCALIAYLFHYRPKSEQNFSQVKDLIRAADVDENNSSTQSKLDLIFEELRGKHPECFAITQYDTFRLGAGKTLKSILISCAVRLQAFDLEDVRALTDTDDIDLDAVADEKTAIFIIVPTGEKTFNFLAGLMYSQLFTRLYRYCENDAEFGQVVVDKDGQVVKVFRATNPEESEQAKERAQKYLESFKNAKILQKNDFTLGGGDTEMDFWEIKDPETNKTLTFRGTEKLAKEAKDKIVHGSVVPNAKRGNGGQRCPVHVRFLLDEFANTGKIPDFTEKISTIRKYEISTTIILQSLKQIRNLYEKEWDVISANCDTTIYLGGGIDNETTEWLNKIFGKKTVRSMNESMSKTGGNETYSRQSLELYTMSQLRTMPNEDCIVIPRSQNPHLGKMYDTPHHPEWDLLMHLPPYAFNETRYGYIKNQTQIVVEEKTETKKADNVEKENPGDTAYRIDQNQKMEHRAAAAMTNEDINMGQKIGDITVIDPIQETKELQPQIDVSLPSSVEEEGVYIPDEEESNDIGQDDVKEMLDFRMDEDFSFSLAPME